MKPPPPSDTARRRHPVDRGPKSRDSESRVLKMIGAFRCRIRANDFGVDILDNEAASEAGIGAVDPREIQLWGNLLHPDDRPVLEQARRAAHDDSDVLLGFRIRTPDAIYLPLLFSGRPIAVSGDAGEVLEGYIVVDSRRLLGSVRDLRRDLEVATSEADMDATERAASTRALQQAQQQLLRATQLAVAGELVGAITHDLRQPLTALQIDVGVVMHLLRQPAPEVAQALSVLEDVLLDERRVQESLQTLEDLVARHAPRREAVSLGKLVAEVARLTSTEATARRVRLELSLASHLPPVAGDPTLLREAVLSVLLDAVENASALEGEVSPVSISTRHVDDAHVELSVSYRRRDAPSDEHPLALSVVQSVADAHHAVFAVDTDPMSGVTIRTIWPALNESVA